MDDKTQSKTNTEGSYTPESLEDLKVYRATLEKQRYSKDFWAFAKELKIVPDLQEQPHREVLDFILTPDKYKLLLVCRDSFKSTIMVAYMLWSLTNNPNLRILIDSRTADRSKELLFHVKEHIEKNEQFRELYGDWKYIPGWREQSFVHPQRTAKYREPTIKVAGIDAPVTGGHYEIIIADDLHDESNSQTEAACDKVIMHYKTLLPILEPTGHLMVVGTIWSHIDLYHHIQSNEEGWKILKRPARNEDGTLWFPARITEEYLADRKQKMGPYLFSAQYMLEAIAPEDRRFESSWIKYLPVKVISSEGHIFLDVNHGRIVPANVSITVDPAIGQKKGSDFTGITAVGCDHIDDWYVLSGRRLKVSAPELIEAIIFEIRLWQAGRVGIETVAYQKALKEFLEPRLEAEGLHVELVELTTGTGRGKNARIEGLVPRFAAGRIFFREGIDPELEYEVLHWNPRKEMRHDDLIDALSHQIDLAIPASALGQRVLSPEYYDLSPEDRKKMRDRKKRLSGIGRGSPTTGYEVRK